MPSEQMPPKSGRFRPRGLVLAGKRVATLSMKHQKRQTKAAEGLLDHRLHRSIAAETLRIRSETGCAA